VPPAAFVSPELARRLSELSRLLNRQIGLLIDRRGEVELVVVGDAHRLFIPDLSRARAGAGRFRGLRLVHTHLRGEGLSRDDLTDLILLRLDLVLVIQAQPDGLPGGVELGWVRPEIDPERGAALIELADAPGAELPWQTERRANVHQWSEDFQEFIKELEGRFSKVESTRKVSDGEGCVLVGVTLGDAEEARASLAELARLAETAGLDVKDSVLQVRKVFEGRTVLGSGKLQEVLVRAMQLGASVLVFDSELSPSQLRNIATETELKVIDRTQLILDIFSQRATSSEGKLQVELAQLRYRKPRLALMPTAMSRLTGGIGGRGPGETKLEINRRRADERETRLEHLLEELGRQRALRRARRRRVGLPHVAIVGYTNAGKSTLLNTMTNAEVDAEDKLFATLDPTSRRLRFPEARDVVLTDTVGFIRALPEALVHAFRSTLEESVQADLLLHVVDATSPELELHMVEVERTLDQIEAGAPRLVVLNKVDAVPAARAAELRQRLGALAVSAQTGEGTAALLVEIERRLFLAAARAEAGRPQALGGWRRQPWAQAAAALMSAAEAEAEAEERGATTEGGPRALSSLDGAGIDRSTSPAEAG
jgi:GTP-binding protein HflX